MRTVSEIFEEYESKFKENIFIPVGCSDINKFLEEVEKCIKENHKFNWDEWNKELPDDAII